MKAKKMFQLTIQNILAWCLTIVMLVPLAVVFVNSFKTEGEALTLDLSLPAKLMFSNYQTVIERGKLVASFINSFTYASLSSIVIVLLTSLAAFVLARNQSKLNRAIYYFIILGIAMPLNYVSLMKVMQVTHLINTRIGIILLYAALGIPISLFISYAFVDTIPRELDEAAIIDGCSPGNLFLRVIFPLMKPVLVTLFVLNFMSTWNDFILPLYYLNQSTKWPMTLAVYNFFGQYMQSWNLVCADIVLTCAPVLLVFILGQKHIVGGITSGAVKG
jgi:raffinose/stachyose/melibiose transport system permease protein